MVYGDPRFAEAELEGVACTLWWETARGAWRVERVLHRSRLSTHAWCAWKGRVVRGDGEKWVEMEVLTLLRERGAGSWNSWNSSARYWVCLTPTLISTPYRTGLLLYRGDIHSV